MKKLIKKLTATMLVALFAIVVITSCGKKAESDHPAGEHPSDSTEHPHDSTEHPSDHPEHPADSTKADSTKSN